MSDPLTQLRPLHLPTDIDWWPPALGWWLLALLLVLIVLLVLCRVIAWQRAMARREALIILRAIEQQDLAAPMLAQQVNLLLRRYAMACYPQRNASAFTGQAWLEFLHEHGAGRDFKGASGHALTGAAFAAYAQVDRHELMALARHWVRHNSPAKLTRKTSREHNEHQALSQVSGAVQ
jgi:hypothetical protein